MSMDEALASAEPPAPAPPRALPAARQGRWRSALDRPTHDKLAGGRLPIEGRVDLHGMTQEEAYSLLLSFLSRAHANGIRYVLVITGKGHFVGRRRRAAPRGAGLAGDRAVPRAGRQPRSCRAPPWRRRRALCAPAAQGAMTPFGAKIRALRAERGVSQKDMAAALGVSAAYLSALEHGRRGVPGWALGAEDHRLFQHHLGRRRGIAAAGRRSPTRA